MHLSKKTTVLIAMVVLVMVLILASALFLVPWVKQENSLALQIPAHIAEQVSKRHETYVPISSISPFIKEAVIASQDKRFYSNPGVDIVATLRALYFTILSGKREGASTITEQLAKNVYYHDTDTLATDLETKMLALFITLHFQKDKILEMYLNDIYYGKGAYGISQAATTYFQTTPDGLSLSQSVFLIALITAPSYLSAHQQQAYQQAALVLQEMVHNNYISPQNQQRAEKEMITHLHS